MHRKRVRELDYVGKYQKMMRTISIGKANTDGDSRSAAVASHESFGGFPPDVFAFVQDVGDRIDRKRDWHRGVLWGIEFH